MKTIEKKQEATTKPEATTPKPSTFFDAVKTLIRTDIAQADKFVIVELKECGKYGYGHFLLAGEDAKAPYKDTYIFTFLPGSRSMEVKIFDDLNHTDPLISYENMERIYGELDPRAFQNFKHFGIFREVY